MPAATNTLQASPTGGVHKKFGTFAGLGQMSTNKSATSSAASGGTVGTRPSVKGLFEASGNDAGAGASSRAALSAEAGGANGSAARSASDGPWSISVAEVPDKREGRKRKHQQTAYTLYITTPTHNITLTRSGAEIVELDQRIRENQSVSTSLPSLPSLPSAAPQTSGRRILKTISRTLSPSGSRNRAALEGLRLEPTTPTSLTAEARRLASPPPSAPLSPAMDEKAAVSAHHSTTTQLATYFTTISNLPFIRRHKAWVKFTRVGSDDLQSVRVERRVRKVRSDLAQHVKSSVAPTNTNVGVGPSDSDLGEDDGGRTDDEREGPPAKEQRLGSASPRPPHSGSAMSLVPERRSSVAGSMTRPDVPVRSSSVDKGSNIGDASMSPNAASQDTERQRSHAGIPEEQRMDESGDDAEASAPRRRSTRRGQRRTRESEKVTVDDFEMIRVLGKGCAGKVLLVRHNESRGLFAMKSIYKRHVLAHQELQHTLTEQSVLKRMVKEVMDPFVVRLWWSFHDRNNLYLVMDFHPGGDLATQLSRWGRLGRDRARFYAAEIVEGVEGLHKAGVIYRDLKPENVLIGADGHIVLSDFGLSKEFSGHAPVANGSSTPPPGSPGRSKSSNNVRSAHWLSASDDTSVSSPSTSRFLDKRETTSTFCGTAEYLAPEVIQGLPYSYEVDWWSFGTMLYEMLTGITPFWADTHADMYVRVLQDELVFPEDRVLDQDTKSIIRGLLQRNPMLRMKEPRIKKHPYFSMIEWDHIFHKRYIPPYIPPIDPQNEVDTQNFDETFLEMQPTVAHAAEEDEEAEAAAAAAAGVASNGDNTAADQSKDSANNALAAAGAAAVDQSHLFDGYSFRGRRDSESIRSSIMSIEQDEPSAVEDAVVESSSAATPVADTTRSDTTTAMDEDEDEESAARAAVAALARLESEADAEAQHLAHGSTTLSESTQPGSVGPSREATSNGTSDSDHSHASNLYSSPASSYTSKPGTKAVLSAGGQPTNAAIREHDDEDDDWDMIDVGGPDGALKSEMNGGKGANLFARGVVDTYRLLRRQESSRLPSSTSYGSTSSRPFNRLGKRRTMVGAGSMRNKPSTGNLTSASAQSLDPRPSERSGAEDTSGDQSLLSPQLESGGSRLGDANGPSSPENGRRKVVSPSLSGSEENKYQTRMKKIKRFTTFFEPASYRS
ncbi:uncharacterized protein PFL1_05470 [Pseudozyma flocculosa PF-1]|uniref:Related to serine/threonine protein kinase B-related Ukb1 n=2 Tax=Pseudozyma flocculosa TaxID=84751 RepID=A0A5C3FEG7_9BASI|nr:uncharacterized protein PFL1_05470 [Pseudozyma flocculosa PF-1]EPQ26835.1 hypothetical protein PFL1_05470 [Pseudozyma flocculosa PF-1]SPO42095.1 related to serine/threonine protein kinase B-related Ukb1 [Pseudozyma flocculosa]